jgi:sugar phosphate isomerase/epimerase
MKIGCSSYSFRKEWGKAYDFTKLESWKKLKENFPEIKGWELLDGRMENSLKDTEPEDLLELKKMVNEAGFEWYAVTTGSGSFSGNTIPHYGGEAAYLEGFKRDNEFRIGFADEWVENAATVGAKFMRIDFAPFFMNHIVSYSTAFDWNINRNVEVYREICNMAKEHGIEVGIENHGGFAGDIKVIRKMMADVPDLKLCFDFGNVRDADRYQMCEEFADRMHFVHAKAHIFDDKGIEKNIDYGRIINTLKDKGFDSWLSIEWEGPLPGDEGVRKTIDLIKKYI